MPASKAAREIADAIEARRGELVLTRHGKLAVSVARHAPGLVGALVGVTTRRKRR
jgi:hypothetical protein